LSVHGGWARAERAGDLPVCASLRRQRGYVAFGARQALARPAPGRHALAFGSAPLCPRNRPEAHELAGRALESGDRLTATAPPAQTTSEQEHGPSRVEAKLATTQWLKRGTEPFDSELRIPRRQRLEPAPAQRVTAPTDRARAVGHGELERERARIRDPNVVEPLECWCKARDRRIDVTASQIVQSGSPAEPQPDLNISVLPRLSEEFQRVVFLRNQRLPTMCGDQPSEQCTRTKHRPVCGRLCQQPRASDGGVCLLPGAAAEFRLSTQQQDLSLGNRPRPSDFERVDDARYGPASELAGLTAGLRTSRDSRRSTRSAHPPLWQTPRPRASDLDSRVNYWAKSLLLSLGILMATPKFDTFTANRPYGASVW
jgi:hypothetical protein